MNSYGRSWTVLLLSYGTIMKSTPAVLKRARLCVISAGGNFEQQAA
jgi:hypothetical protein